MSAAPFSLPSSRPCRSFPSRNESLIYPIFVSLVKKQVKATRREARFLGIHVSLRARSQRKTTALSQRNDIGESFEAGAAEAAGDDQKRGMFQAPAATD